MLRTESSVPLLFGKGGNGVLDNCSLFGTEATLFFSVGPVCSSFFAEACAILHALCWSWQHLQVCNFFSLLFLTDFRFVLATLFSSSSFLLTHSLWQELSSLSSCSIRLQWVHGHSFLPGNGASDDLARLEALLVHSVISCSHSLLLSLVSNFTFSQTRGILTYLNFSTHRFPQFPPRNLCFFDLLAVFSLVFVAKDTAYC